MRIDHPKTGTWVSLGPLSMSSKLVAEVNGGWSGPVEFEVKLSGADGKKYVLRFNALDEDIAKRAKNVPSAVFDDKAGVHKGKAIPGDYDVTAQPIAQGSGGGTDGPGHLTIGAASKPVSLGKVTITPDVTKPIPLTFPH